MGNKTTVSDRYNGGKTLGSLLCAGIASGLIAALSFNVALFSFIAWAALIPYLWALRYADYKRGMLVSFVFGLAFYGATCFWVAHVTVAGLIALLCYLALYVVLFFLLANYFLDKPFSILTVPAVWVITEFFKENVWCGFGWGNLGYSQYRNLYLIQTVDIFGVKFISFLIVMVNVLLYERLSKRALSPRKIIFVCAVFALSFAYSFFCLRAGQPKKTVDIALIQPNTAEVYRWDEQLRRISVGKLKDLSKRTSLGSLLIYPEAAWPYVVDEGNYEDLVSFVRASGRDTLIGVVAQVDDTFYNTALLLGKDGALLDSYRKIKLVPFGEYIPLRRYLGSISALNAVGDMSRGKTATVFSHADTRFGVLICFEDVSPLFVAQLRGENDFLVNITNDGWFRGEPEASQHFGIMTFRAIENRIPIVRAANTGISGWVSGRGEITVLKDSLGKQVLSTGILQCKVPCMNKKSFYTRTGDIFPFFCSLGLLVIFILLRNPRVKAPVLK
ncbi:MAG: apolipoprotein N-acyltransferase [Candidatus Omnitrophica bacterium]|nr:apolipoprotein N-acyltransferase [Candidatus Omnitrophota bacterium]